MLPSFIAIFRTYARNTVGNSCYWSSKYRRIPWANVIATAFANYWISFSHYFKGRVVQIRFYHWVYMDIIRLPFVTDKSNINLAKFPKLRDIVLCNCAILWLLFCNSFIDLSTHSLSKSYRFLQFMVFYYSVAFCLIWNFPNFITDDSTSAVRDDHSFTKFKYTNLLDNFN
jgi:hypothetical protein